MVSELNKAIAEAQGIKVDKTTCDPRCYVLAEMQARIAKLEAVLSGLKIKHKRCYTQAYIDGVVDCFPDCVACKIEEALKACEPTKSEGNDD